MTNKKRNFGDIEFEESNEIETTTNKDNEEDDDFENDEEIEEQEEESYEEEEFDAEGKEGEDDMDGDKGPNKVWRAGIDPLEEDEVLDYDSSAYDMMHSMSVEWPCLSFHPIKDELGAQRNKYPHTMYLVAGTQADEAKNNKIIIMKAKSLHKTKHDDDDSDEDESDDDEESDDEDKDQDPELSLAFINHNGAVNRIRAMDQQSNIVATWSDNRSVYIWNIANHLKALDSETAAPKMTAPIHTITNHSTEGYALDWSSKVAGRLASGDCNNNIFITNASGSTWKTDAQAFKGHTESVEDIQWSPSEEKVFASCSIDQTVRIWDIRKPKPAISVKAHSADVNVISWSRNVEYLLVSGCDDGSFRVWDLRAFKDNSPVSDFKYHTGPITSIEWNPYEESQVIVSSSDDQVTIWDFSLEEDTEEFKDANNNPDDDFQYPPQLFFIHQGQHDIKEVHWHPQIPHVAISTSIDGFNIFKSSNSEE